MATIAGTHLSADAITRGARGVEAARTSLTRGLVVMLLGLSYAPMPAHSVEMLAGQRLSKEVIGGTLIVTPDKFAMAAGGIAPPIHTSPLGKPCLTVSPMAKQQIVNKSIYDHILVLNNVCAQPVRIRACYYGTTDCTVMAVSGYKTEQHNLGVFPARDFRYSYREFVY